MPVSHGVNKKACPIVSLHPTPLPGFYPVCLLFYKKYFIKHFFSDRIMAKNNAFSDQKNVFLQTYCWSVLILLLRIYVFLRKLFHSCTITKLRIASYLHIFMNIYIYIYMLPIWSHIKSCGIGKNSWPWFESYKLL